LTRIGRVYAQEILSAIDDRLSAFALTVGALEWDAALLLGQTAALVSLAVWLLRLRSASQSLWEWKLKTRSLRWSGARCRTFSSGFHGFGRCAAQARRGPLKGRTRYPLSFCRGSRAGCNNVDFAGDTPATTDPQVRNPAGVLEQDCTFHPQTGTRELSLASSRI
jgi:hypothetical protein